MMIGEAAASLGISERMLRHYEARGLLTTPRNANGYRYFGEKELRRARNIRDLIGAGFSTGEVRTMSPCLDADQMAPCADGVEDMRRKIGHIDALMAELQSKRRALAARMALFEDALATPDRERS